MFLEMRMTMKTAEEVIDRWVIKAREKKEKGLPENSSSLFKDLPPRLPALLLLMTSTRVPEGWLTESWDQGVVFEGKGWTEEEAGKLLFEMVGACPSLALIRNRLFVVFLLFRQKLDAESNWRTEMLT